MARGRGDRRHADRGRQRDAEADELRHGHQEVVGRAFDAERMHVAAIDVRQEALREHRARRLEDERAHAMADVEEDAALARRPISRPDVAAGRRGRVGKRLEAMGEHVARPQSG